MLLTAFVLPGMVGGLIRGLVGIQKHVLQQKEPFKPGALLVTLIIAAVVGGVTATITGADWRLSILAGYAGSDLLESLYKNYLIKGFKLFS